MRNWTDKPFSQINLTPMVGVLLALFAVLASVGQPSGIPATNAPIVPGEPYYPLPPGVIVKVSAAGVPLVDGMPSSWEDVAQESKAKLAVQKANWPYPNQDLATIAIDADEGVSYGAVFELYRRLEAAGVPPAYLARDPVGPELY